MYDLAHLTAVILAGGLGTRLRRIVPDRPKVLAEVRGRPFLTYILDQLHGVEVKSVVLCTGYLGEQVEAAFGDTYRDIRLCYSKEEQPLGTAGALGQARSFLQSDPVLVLNGDSFCDVDLNLFWRWHRQKGALASLLLVEVSDVGRFGQVHVDKDELIAKFDEKGNSEGSGWINAGVYLISPLLIDRIAAQRPPVSLERDVFPAWIGNQFFGFRCKETFLDIGVPDSYARAQDFFSPETVNSLVPDRSPERIHPHPHPGERH